MESRDMGGIIFKNTYKEKDTHPDYKGEIVVRGEKLEIALWVKEGKNGKFFSVKVSEPYVKEGQIGGDDSIESDSKDLPF